MEEEAADQREMAKDHYNVGSMEAPSKAFLLFFLLHDWLKLNHLKSRMECGFSDICSRHICCTVAEAIGVKNYTASFGAKNVQKTTFKAAEMMPGPWNQQTTSLLFKKISALKHQDLRCIKFTSL